MTTTMTSNGTCTCWSLLETGTSNTLPVVLSYDNFTVNGIAGTSLVSTGSYIVQSVTFVATQPLHTIRLATEGTATAGTVNFDDIQFEPGSTFTSFTSTGSVLYGVFRGFVERWPPTWEHAGYRGLVELTCTDAFSVFANTFLHSEYRNALAAKAPDYYWPLSEPNGATSFADASGSNKPN